MRPTRRAWLWILALCLTVPLGWGCASQECNFHSECGEGFYCELGRCNQDCQMDLDCAAGQMCTVLGQCVSASDGGRIDGGGIDGGGIDGGGVDGGGPRDSGRRPDAGGVDSGGGTDSGGTDSGGTDSGGTDSGGTDSGGMDAGSDTDAGGDTDAGPPGPVGRGSYLYRRIAIGGLNDSNNVVFHPDGSYAIVVERTNEVHVFDWETETAVQLDLRVSGRAVSLNDIHFDPSGAFAYIVGTEISPSETGVIIRFDDATWRSAGDLTAFTRLSETRAGERFTGIEYPAAGDSPAGDGRPVVLSASGSSPGFVARLRELDPSTDSFAGLFVAQATSAGCDDLAFVDNEFGTWGIVIVCGSSWADTKYYTEIAGTPEWRPGPAATLGNTSRADAHPSSDYALAIGWPGRRVHRFEAGTWMPTSGAPWFTTQGIRDVTFAPDGRRALVVGRTSVGRGTVIEYRHDLYSFSDFTDVSIAGFDAPPYNGNSNTYLNDSAFRPGCDGGLIVGGNISGATGLLIEFQIESATACR